MAHHDLLTEIGVKNLRNSASKHHTVSLRLHSGMATFLIQFNEAGSRTLAYTPGTFFSPQPMPVFESDPPFSLTNFSRLKNLKEENLKSRPKITPISLETHPKRQFRLEPVGLACSEWPADHRRRQYRHPCQVHRRHR